MSQLIKCLDCSAEIEINYECCKGIIIFILIDLSNTPINNDEDITKKIKEIEELTNFNIKKNICLNCIDKLIKERESNNSLLHAEKELLTNALEALMSEIESTEFSKNI